MTPTSLRHLRFALLALASILVAAPGVHVAERWMDHETAVLVTHVPAVLLLALVTWRWRSGRVDVPR